MQRRDLTPFDGVQARLLAMERKFPAEVLVGLNRDNAELHDVYRLDLVTGELAKEVENPGFVEWIADAQMVVRDTARADWRELLTIPADDALTSDAIAFSEDGSSLLGTTSVGANTGRLVRIDAATGAQEVL